MRYDRHLALSVSMALRKRPRCATLLLLSMAWFWGWQLLMPAPRTRVVDGIADAPPWLRQSMLLPPFTVRPQCPNWFIVQSADAGIGHRMTAVIFGIALGLQTGTGIMLDDQLLQQARSFDSESYPWMLDAFNLNAFPLAKADAGVVFDWNHNPLWSWDRGFGVLGEMTVQKAVRHGNTSCNQLIPLRTGHVACESATGVQWCQSGGISRAFEVARPLMSGLYNIGKFARKPLVHFGEVVNAKQPSLAVVWHVRNDDIKLHGGDVDFWTKLVRSVLQGLKGVRAHHYILSQFPISTTDEYFGFLHSLPGFQWTPILTDVATAFYHLAAADVLVHSGSSFALVAGIAAAPSQVSVYVSPKESARIGDEAYMTYWLDGSVVVQLNGTIMPADVHVLRQAAEHRSRHKPAQWTRPSHRSLLGRGRR